MQSALYERVLTATQLLLSDGSNFFCLQTPLLSKWFEYFNWFVCARACECTGMHVWR